MPRALLIARESFSQVDGLGALSWSYTPTHANATPDRPWRSSEGDELQKFNYAEHALEVVLSGDERHGGAPFNLFPCPWTTCYDTTSEVVEARNGVPKPFAENERPNCCYAKQTGNPRVTGGVFSVKMKSEETTAESLRTWNPGCSDVIDMMGAYQDLIQGAFASSVPADECGGCPFNAPLCLQGDCIVPTCSAMQRFCQKSSISGVRARQLCPHTCQCNVPRGSLVLSLPQSGCGEFCWRVRASLLKSHMQSVLICAFWVFFCRRAKSTCSPSPICLART